MNTERQSSNSSTESKSGSGSGVQPEPFNWTYDQWNAVLDAGAIKELPKQEHGFLMIGQRMKALVEYKGHIYEATAWGNPMTPLVEMRPR